MGVRPETRRPLTSRERSLLDRLVAQCGPRLLAYVRRACGRSLDAEDIVAETFCRAAENVTTLRRCERQDLYLLAIARNLCRDRFRRQAPLDSAEAPPLPAVADPGPDEVAVRVERRRAVLAAVAALPEAQREVVVLRLSGMLKFEEIAGLLNVPLGTVLSRMHAALQRLKQDVGAVHEH